MKTFIVGLFSLVVLASGAAWGHPPEGTPDNDNLPAIQGFCAANDGIFVILVKNDGKAYFAKCKELKGPPIRPITKKNKPDTYDKTFESYTLGDILKTGLVSDPKDPCITWTVGGSRYYYCW